MPIGNPVTLTSNVASKTISAIATAGQTLFTVTGGYRLNYLAVYRNGTKLVESLDYTARDGNTITLISPSTIGDVLEFEIFDTFRVADAVNANDDNVNFAGTVNIHGNLNVIGVTTIAGAATSVAIARTAYELTGTPNISVGIITATSASFSGNISVAGTITYEDVTNVDSLGIITARSGVLIGPLASIGSTLSSSGDATFSGRVSAGSSFVGNGTIPVGGIIMWSGTIANIPTGWALCNGSNGTPDLRNRFIVAAGTDTQNVWSFNATSGISTFTNGQTSVGVGSTGGEIAHQLTIAELASHTHTYQRNNGAWNTGTSGNTAVAANQGESSYNTSSTGGDQYHENRPPYYALAFIMRTL
jgi:microcystin-dependent protein